MTEPTNPTYHWTPCTMRAFLAALADTGSISQAAKEAGKSARAAYLLRRRPEGAALKLGWDAAMMIARAVVLAELMDRAMFGEERVTISIRDPEGRTTRTQGKNSRLGMSLLTRLDRIVDSERPAYEPARARLVAEDFDAFLDLVEAGGSAADADRFVAERQRTEQRNHCELTEATAMPKPRLTPDAAVAKMRVWYCEDRGMWWTNFPPPDDFNGEAEGAFTDDEDTYYARTLTLDEYEIWTSPENPHYAPIYAAGEAARRRHFGLPEGDEVVVKPKRKAKKTTRKVAKAPKRHAGSRRIAVSASTVEQETAPQKQADTWPLTHVQGDEQAAATSQLENDIAPEPNIPPEPANENQDNEEFINGVRIYIPGTKLYTKEYQDMVGFRQIICDPPRPYDPARPPPWAERVW